MQNLWNKFLEKTKDMTGDQQSISFKFYLLCKDIIKTDNSNRILDISPFLYLFILKNKDYNPYIQNDCKEFCRLFLNNINYELNENKIVHKYKEFKYNNDLNLREIEIGFINFFQNMI